MRHLMPLLATAVLVLSTAAAHADLGDQLAMLLPDDGAANDEFGRFVAISGPTAIVGAWKDDDNGDKSGSAYLFDTTTGQQIAKLLPDDGAAVDMFGKSAAICGAVAIVGAWTDNDNGINSGSVYLFDITTGQQIAKLLPDDGAAHDHFGWSVAISGTTAIVGSNRDDDNGTASGSAYLFDTTTGAQIAKLVPDDGAEEDQFGRSVAISGTTAIVGAFADDDNGDKSGSAYLFDTTTGQQVAKLLPDDGAEGHEFGCSVAISGTTGIVGAEQADDNGGSSGSAYLFDTATGQQIAKLLPDDGVEGDRFGVSVAISGTTAIIGAFRHLHEGDKGFTSGSAYLFDTTTGQQIAKLLPEGGADTEHFGFSVGISGAITIVGAYGSNENGLDSGSAYLFDAADGVASAPDCDGDGVADDVDACPGETGTAANNGCPEMDDTQQLCGSGMCNPGGASFALLFGLLLMRFGCRRPTRRT